jgi:hypothetical protein
MSLTLFDIQSSAHSIEIKNAAGQALAIDASGYLTANVNGSVTVVDGGGSLTVDGTVAATQSGTWDIGTVGTITNAVTIVDGGGSITVDGSVETTQGGFSDWKVSAQAIASATESEIAATPLTGRVSILIQNLSSSNIYVKNSTGVSTSNGMLIPKNGVYEADLDDNANIFAIAHSGASNDIRVVEYKV